jgi:DNA-binding transcriptional MerR regulator
MTRPSPGDPFPYTRGDVTRMTGASVPTVKNLQEGHVLRKRAGGTGHHTGYNFDDALRIAVSRQLLDRGLQVASIQSLFDALEAAPSAGRPWRWLRSPEARMAGAILVLVSGHPFGPNPRHAGHVILTTKAEAKRLLLLKLRGGVSVVSIDVGGLIDHLEERTGERYEDNSEDATVPHDEQQ